MKKRKRDQVKGLEVGADELLAGEQNSVTATVRDEAGDPLSRELVTRAYEHTDSRTDGDNCANGHTRVGANDDTYVNEHTRADVQVLPYLPVVVRNGS